MKIPRFDERHAIFFDQPEPRPLLIDHVQRLSGVDDLENNTPLLATQVGDDMLVIPTLTMVFHKVAQGTLNGVPYMVTFCAICHAGSVFSPLVDGQLLHFGSYGFHHGMALLSDAETHSRWNHITGNCLHGPQKGAELQQLENLTHTTVGSARSAYPDAYIAFSAFTPEESEIAHRWRVNYLGQSPEWPEELTSTLIMHDDRRSRFDLGVGVWTKESARYYPMLDINAEDNVIVDMIDGRNIVVYEDHETGLPSVFYTSADRARWSGEALHLNDGTVYLDGVLSHNNQPVRLERPYFQVIRWYGFSYLFPNCDIYSNGQ